jgi:hypothetical protein
VSEHEPPDFEQCTVCGRTALRGERLWDYVTSGGEHRRVCALCKPRAEAAGWVPAELAAQRAAQMPRPSRARALRQRLGRAVESARASRPAGEAGLETEDEERPRRRRRLLVEREPVPDGGGSRGREVAPRSGRGRQREGSGRRPPGAEVHRWARTAIDRYDASEARRTVAGLIKSLGEPRASLRPGKAGGAVLTIAWELSWYQWEIDPGEHGQVREIRKGDEMDELSDRERDWNALVADDGSLRLTSA